MVIVHQQLSTMSVHKWALWTYLHSAVFLYECLSAYPLLKNTNKQLIRMLISNYLIVKISRLNKVLPVKTGYYSHEVLRRSDNFLSTVICLKKAEVIFRAFIGINFADAEHFFLGRAHYSRRSSLLYRRILHILLSKGSETEMQFKPYALIVWCVFAHFFWRWMCGQAWRSTAVWSKRWRSEGSSRSAALSSVFIRDREGQL